MLERLAWVVGGYVCGSIPFAYLAGRWWRGIDLRRSGSRKVSGSNLYEYLGATGLILVGILEVAKAALPTWLALRHGPGLPTAVATGLAAMVGHNWSLFLGLKGGRGISAALGLLVVIFPWGCLWLLIWLALGRLVPHAAAIPALVALLLMPALAIVLQAPNSAVIGCVVILIMTMVKRLEGNRERLPEGERLRAVLWRRLLLDRDIADWDAWAHREPDNSSGPLDR